MKEGTRKIGRLVRNNMKKRRLHENILQRKRERKLHENILQRRRERKLHENIADIMRRKEEKQRKQRKENINHVQLLKESLQRKQLCTILLKKQRKWRPQKWRSKQKKWLQWMIHSQIRWNRLVWNKHMAKLVKVTERL